MKEVADSEPEYRIQFVSDHLVDDIMAGLKNASVAWLHEVDVDEDDYNHALVCGRYYTVYDLSLRPRCRIRISAMELCRWDAIPERLWRGETERSAGDFRSGHVDYFDNPTDDFEFVAYYFYLAPPS